MREYEIIPEPEYRRLRQNSSSSLKEFSLDRRKYYKKYILSETVEETPNKASDMGRIVETLLMEPEKFDDLFFMSTLDKIPGGMLGEFIYLLSKFVSKEATEEGVSDEVFEECARRAYDRSGFKWSFETVLSKLDDPENTLYYEECMKVDYNNMTMVTAQDIENAEQIVDNLRNNTTTSRIVNLSSDARFTVMNQMSITDYEIDGMILKSLLDKVIIDNVEKIIYPYDLKCTWSVEGFYKEYYLYRRAYIQAYLYKKALEYLTKFPENPFYGYKVENLKFIVCDSINYYDPLIYTVSDEDMKDAYLGFTHKDKKYPGVKQIIEELLWAIDNDKWTISKTNYDKGGVLNIKD